MLTYEKHCLNQPNINIKPGGQKWHKKEQKKTRGN